MEYTALHGGEDVLRIWVAMVWLCFVINLLLILGTNRFADCGGTEKAAAAAALAAGYYGVCLLPGGVFLRRFFWWGCCTAAVLAIAFGNDWYRWCIFTVLNLALQSLLAVMGRGNIFPILVFSGVFCLLGGIRKLPERIPVAIAHGGRVLSLLALRDTGNILRDPVTGSSVLVIDADAAGKLTGLTLQELNNPIQTLTQSVVPGLRLIPFQAVGQSDGLLLAKQYKEVTVGRSKGTRLVAFAPQKLGDSFQALAGGMA